ncbi:MAG: hypothetical protein MK066_05685 [Crocinitomicaceae bacterium]|nr:hypothetical protein [Crocinitomicaceae bacterium]
MKKRLNRKMTMSLSIGVLSMLCNSLVFAQTEGPDIIELKNGTEHQGTIIEQRPGSFLRLWQVPSNDTLTISYKDVQALKKTPIAGVAASNSRKDEIVEAPLVAPSFNDREYYLNLIGSLSGGDWANIGMGFGLMRVVSPRIQVGFSARYNGADGISLYNSIPILGEFKYVLQESNNGRTSLLLSLSAGYNIYLDSKTVEEGVPTYVSNGLYFNPNIGYRFNFTKNTGVIIDLGYQYMGGNKLRQSNDDFLQKRRISNVSLKATLFF